MVATLKRTSISTVCSRWMVLTAIIVMILKKRNILHCIKHTNTLHVFGRTFFFPLPIAFLPRTFRGYVCTIPYSLSLQGRHLIFDIYFFISISLSHCYFILGWFIIVWITVSLRVLFCIYIVLIIIVIFTFTQAVGKYHKNLNHIWNLS